MIDFLDGPAAGIHLMLRSCPAYLRVVRSSRGNWDALDQPGDVANPQETIFVYHWVTVQGRMHIRCSPRSASGFYAMAEYQHVADCPLAQADLRSNVRWMEWELAEKFGKDGSDG